VDTLREEVKSELINQEGRYNPNDRDVNVRIVEDIRVAINELADGVIPSAQHIAEVAIATNENLQIRDFLMGVQLETDLEFVGEYIQLLGNVIVKEKAIPLATIFCGFLYQIDEREQASEFLNKILDAKPNYSLHPKVVDTIYEIDNGDSNDD